MATYTRSLVPEAKLDLPGLITPVDHVDLTTDCPTGP